jgi:hypothetical protein
LPSKTTTRAPRRPKPEQVHDDQLRTSERLAFNRCRQRHHWNYTEKLSPRREAPQLRFGTLIHAALEVYYGTANMRRKKPSHPADIFVKLYDAELAKTRQEWDEWRDEDDTWHEYRALGEAMLVGYIEHWEASPSDNEAEYRVLATEQRFRMPIIVPDGCAPLLPTAPTMYVGTLDRILLHLPTKRLLIGDYKTTKNDPTRTSHLALDEQAGAYWAYIREWLLNYAPPALNLQLRKQVDLLPPAYRGGIRDLRFDGIMYDFMKKSMPNKAKVRNAAGQVLNQPTAKALGDLYKSLDRPKPANGTGSGVEGAVIISDLIADLGDELAYSVAEVSKVQPTELFHRETVFRDEADRQNVLKRIYDDAQEIGMVRAGTLAIKKSPDTFICIGCQFRDMCEVHEVGGDWQLYRRSAFTTHDPYSTYAIDWDEKG